MMERETRRLLERIRKSRVKKKISQYDFALELGVAPSHLYYIESKRVVPSADLVVKIAKALRIKPADLWR